MRDNIAGFREDPSDDDIPSFQFCEMDPFDDDKCVFVCNVFCDGKVRRYVSCCNEEDSMGTNKEIAMSEI